MGADAVNRAVPHLQLVPRLRVGSWAELMDYHGPSLAHAVPRPRSQRPGSSPRHTASAGILRRNRAANVADPSHWRSTTLAGRVEPQALLATLVNSGVPPFGPQPTEWFLDTGASSHMASIAGNFPSPIPLSPPSIIVGNGATLPVTHRAATAIATTQSPLHLSQHPCFSFSSEESYFRLISHT